MLKSLFPNHVKLNNTIDALRLGSNFTIRRTIKFTKKFISYQILDFTKSHSGPSNGPPKGYTRKVLRTCRSKKLINITVIDKVLLKSDCNKESIVKGVRVRETFLLSFDLGKHPGHEIHKKLRNKLLTKKTISFLSIYLFLNADDLKPVTFSGEILTFTCQLMKS